MPIELWITFFVASMILCFTPGPTVLMVMGQGFSHGKQSTLPVVAGVLSGDLIAMGLSLVGVGGLLAVSAELFTLLKWLGAAYLIFLGVKAWRGKHSTPDGAAALSTRGGSAFRAALVITALNPKSILFFMAFFPLFIRPEHALLPQLTVLGLTFLVASTASTWFYAACSGLLRDRINSPGFEQRFGKLSGGLLIGAGLFTASIQK